MSVWRKGGLAAAVMALGLPASAQDLTLIFPLACTLGSDCHIQQYPDRDPGPGAADHTCGPLSYDGHDGTDFAVATLADLGRGVAVLAAADGVVAGVRDGMEDALQGIPGAPDIAGRECGNGVLIRHPGGWETQYCHLARGSVAVSEGQAVTAGTVLGRIGLSGQTEFPHVHLSVRRDGQPVDPFDPAGTDTCGDGGAGLWSDPLPYQPGGVTDAGLATGVPDFAEVTAGTADRALAVDQPLVAFGLIFGGRVGDVVTIAIDGPAGRVFDHAETLERTQAQLFRAAGLRAPPEGWPAGDYAATVTLERDGAVVSRLTDSAILP